jgi:hypothetical protein
MGSPGIYYKNRVIAIMTFDVEIVEVDELYLINVGLDVAAKVFNLSVNDLLGPGRNQALSRPRQMVWKIARDNSELTFARIASKFGRKASNVILGIRSLDKKMRDNKDTYWSYQTFGEEVAKRLIDDQHRGTEPSPEESAETAMESCAGTGG